MPSNLNIFGAYDSRDYNNGLLTPQTTLDQVTESSVMADLRAFAAEYDAAVQEMTSMLVEPTEAPQAEFGKTFGGRLQRYDEFGVVEATRTLESFTLGFPIERFRDRQIYTEERLLTITLEELEKDAIAAATRDCETMLVEMLSSFLFKTNYTFKDREFPGSGLGDIAVKRLLNNDSNTGEIYVNGTKISLGSLQHYIGSNTGSITEAVFSAIYAKLKAVYNTNDVVYLISESEESTVRGFSSFIRLNEDNIVNPNKIYSKALAPRAIGRLDNASFTGEVVVMPFMPAGYLFGYDRSKPKPVRFRQHSNASLRGFKLVQNQTRAAYGENSLRNKQWERIGGYGVWDRTNGVAAQIVASTTYTDPTL